MQRQLTQVAVPKVSSHGEKSCVSAGVRCVEPRLERASQAVGLVRAACPKGMWGGGGDGCGHCTHHYLFFPLQRRSTTGVTLSTAAVGVAAASRPGQRTRLLTLDSTSDVSQ